MTTRQTQNQIVFIDSAVHDLATLLAGLAPGMEVVMLQPGSDGLGQIAAALAGRSNLQAIHLISHGSSGEIQLGNTSLSSANLAQYQSALQGIGSHLSASGDILIYGCDVAAGIQGQNLVQQIAQIAQADVAASTTLTGAAALGGNWVLEYQQGSIENGALTIANYSGTLEVLAGLYIQGDGSGGGGGGAAIANGDTLGFIRK